VRYNYGGHVVNERVVKRPHIQRPQFVKREHVFFVIRSAEISDLYGQRVGGKSRQFVAVCGKSARESNPRRRDYGRERQRESRRGAQCARRRFFDKFGKFD
jgi:hypothetical protein